MPICQTKKANLSVLELKKGFFEPKMTEKKPFFALAY